MLKSLHIENIAVVERADVEFREGLNVLTGETGAGKSIVIDALYAVTGGRTSRELVRSGAAKGLAAAVFDADGTERWRTENGIDTEDGELIVQRAISSDGKGSCRVNGVPVTVAQLRALGALLVDIHGQNDGRQLMDERRHREYLDRFGVPETVLNAYGAEYRKYRALEKELEQLSMDEVEKERLSESLRYQIAELERAELKSGEKEGLVSRRDMLRNSEKLTEALDEALRLLYGEDENAVTMAQNAEYYASKASALVPELESSAAAIHEAIFSLSDAAETLRDFRASLDFSPEEYDRLEERISLLNKLERKYSRDEDALIAYLDECREKLDNIASLLSSIEPYETRRVEKIRQRITEGLTAIPDVQYDKNRLEQEMIYYIEKLDISEEKQRLANHLRYFRQTMEDGHGQGKKLGFIAQEMGREINTTGSKSNLAEMQNIVVRMKDELEQIKEQVLNVM